MDLLCEHADGKCSKCDEPMQPNWKRQCKPGRKLSVIAKPSSEPGIFRKASNYSKAIAKWIAAGSPVRSEEEIERIFAICEACPHFKNEGRPQCGLCGCSINKSANGLKSKLAMSTEACPAKPPRW